MVGCINPAFSFFNYLDATDQLHGLLLGDALGFHEPLISEVDFSLLLFENLLLF